MELFDPVTGQVYYYNAETNQSEWEPPVPASFPAVAQPQPQQQEVRVEIT